MIEGNTQEPFLVRFQDGQTTILSATNEHQARGLALYHFPFLSIASVSLLKDNASN